MKNLTPLFGLVLTLSLIHSAAASPKRFVMYTAGDSITAAFLARTSAADKDLDDDVEKVIIDAKLGIGDHKKHWSWASGRSIQSHYVRLREYLSRHEPKVPLLVRNVARSGALTFDLADQADIMEDVYRRGDQIKYVTLLIGNNDVCQEFETGAPDNNLEKRITRFFARVSKLATRNPDQNDRVRVLVSGLPRIPDLGRPDIAAWRINRLFTCRLLTQRVTRFCESLTVWRTEEQYLQRLAQVDAYDNRLRKIVEAAAKQYTNLDFYYSDALSSTPVTLPLLATDCFHPNIKGQSKIAELLWEDQPFFKEALPHPIAKR